MAHEKWANAQVQAAVAIGVNPLDAQRAVKAFLVFLPPGADPNTYVLPGAQLEQDITSEAIRLDALAAWVGRDDVPSQFKLILAAGEDNG